MLQCRLIPNRDIYFAKYPYKELSISECNSIQWRCLSYTREGDEVRVHFHCLQIGTLTRLKQLLPGVEVTKLPPLPPPPPPVIVETAVVEKVVKPKRTLPPPPPLDFLTSM
jgi:hypothetical protein